VENLGLTRLQILPGPILITGHTGFKGTWLTLALESMGISTIGYSLRPSNESLYTRLNRFNRIDEIFCDITDFESLSNFIIKNKPSAIIHLAAQPLVLQSYENPLETFNVNVMGTANVLEAARQNSFVQYIVAATTDKVYKNSEKLLKFKEADPLEGKDPYSASKVGAESVIRAWQNLSESEGGANISAVRSGNVIGGGDFSKDRIVPDIIRSYISRDKLVVRNPHSTRPWQHALDPLFGYLQVLDSQISNSIRNENFNFGPSEKSLPVQAIVDIAFSVLGQDRLRVEYGADETKYEATNLELESTKAGRLLNWTPSLTQHEAIKQTFVWWKKVLSEDIDELAACYHDIDLFRTKYL